MSDARYWRSVERVVEAVEIHSPTTYSWFGQRVEELPERTIRAMDDATARRYLTNTLQWHLYGDFYCKGAATPSLAREGRGRDRAARWSPFVRKLSDANSGRGSSEPGWVFHGHDEGQLVVERHGLTLWVRPIDVVGPGDGDVDLQPGTAVRVRLPKELRRLSPGFYVALGDLGLPADDDEPLVRLYWNLTSTAAHRLVGLGTARLNQAGVAFQLKVADDRDGFDRCDAGVVYLRRSDYPAVAPHVAWLHGELVGDLEPATPAFTKLLGPGLGLAEDPGAGESFGTHRCLLLAEGILDGHAQARTDVAGRVEAVAERFAREGLDLGTPYLSAGSSGDYPTVAP